MGAISEYHDQVERELVALTEPDPLGTGIARDKVRRMLAECWELGVSKGVAYGQDGAASFPVNPFLVADNG